MNNYQIFDMNAINNPMPMNTMNGMNANFQQFDMNAFYPNPGMMQQNMFTMTNNNVINDMINQRTQPFNMNSFPGMDVDNMNRVEIDPNFNMNAYPTSNNLMVNSSGMFVNKKAVKKVTNTNFRPGSRFLAYKFIIEGDISFAFLSKKGLIYKGLFQNLEKTAYFDSQHRILRKFFNKSVLVKNLSFKEQVISNFQQQRRIMESLKYSHKKIKCLNYDFQFGNLSPGPLIADHSSIFKKLQLIRKFSFNFSLTRFADNKYYQKLGKSLVSLQNLHTLEIKIEMNSLDRGNLDSLLSHKDRMKLKCFKLKLAFCHSLGMNNNFFKNVADNLNKLSKGKIEHLGISFYKSECSNEVIRAIKSFKGLKILDLEILPRPLNLIAQNSFDEIKNIFSDIEEIKKLNLTIKEVSIMDDFFSGFRTIEKCQNLQELNLSISRTSIKTPNQLKPLLEYANKLCRLKVLNFTTDKIMLSDIKSFSEKLWTNPAELNISEDILELY